MINYQSLDNFIRFNLYQPNLDILIKATGILTDYTTSFTSLTNPKIYDQIRKLNNRSDQKDVHSCRETFGDDFDSHIFLLKIQATDIIIKLVLEAELCKVPGVILVNDKNDIQVFRGKLIMIF